MITYSDKFECHSFFFELKININTEGTIDPVKNVIMHTVLLFDDSGHQIKTAEVIDSVDAIKAACTQMRMIAARVAISKQGPGNSVEIERYLKSKGYKKQ